MSPGQGCGIYECSLQQPSQALYFLLETKVKQIRFHLDRCDWNLSIQRAGMWTLGNLRWREGSLVFLPWTRKQTCNLTYSVISFHRENYRAVFIYLFF